MDEYTDLELFSEILRRYEIRAATTVQAGEVSVSIDEESIPSSIRWHGYMGFGFGLKFDTAGALISLGSSEG